MAQLEKLIERGDAVTLRALSSYTPEGGYSERLHNSCIQKVYDDGRLRLKLPVEYGDVVTLSLDRIYEIVISTDDETYRGKGMIQNRFLDEEGGSCMFQLTEVLSRDTKKKFLRCEASLSAKFVLAPDQRAGHGIVTRLSMDRLILETDLYLEEKTSLTMEISLENGKELVVSGNVKETLRLRSGMFESEIMIDPGDIRQQKEMARGLLAHADDVRERTESENS